MFFLFLTVQAADHSSIRERDRLLAARSPDLKPGLLGVRIAI